MFSKIFKYDFKFIFRFWWILAVSVTVLSTAGGVLLRALTAELDNAVISVASALGLFAVAMALILFPVAISVLCLIRYYKNFFTDEGYLTFTLPVSRTSLLNSKLLVTILFTLMTFAVVLTDVLILLNVGGLLLEDILRAFQQIGELFNLEYTTLVLGICILFFSSLYSINMMFFCITFGAVISKKHKVLTAFGIYYAISFAVSLVTQLFSLLIVTMLDEIMHGTIPDIWTSTTTFNLFLYIGLTVLFYLLNRKMIRNKLNLN